MKEIFEAIESRVKSPVLGYFSLAFLVINWQSIFYLLFEKVSVLDRITFFNENTDLSTLLLYPAVISALLAVCYPWINFIFLKVCTRPSDLKNALQAQSEHKLLIKRKELEDIRSQVLSNAERELIDRAKRDEELEEIHDEELKERLRAEIENLRQRRDELKNSDPKSIKLTEHGTLLEVAGQYRQRASETKSGYDRDKLLEKARNLEEKAHKLLIGSEDA